MSYQASVVCSEDSVVVEAQRQTVRLPDLPRVRCHGPPHHVVRGDSRRETEDRVLHRVEIVAGAGDVFPVADAGEDAAA